MVWGFGRGLLCGVALMGVALFAANTQSIDLKTMVLEDGVSLSAAAMHSSSVWVWIELNLGHSFWLFLAVLVLYVVNTLQLHGLLSSDPASVRVTQLDQLTDVWMHLFVGIGVVWTAVGMRSALQAALGDSPAAALDSADTVLRKLVDGGILLALTTTIVGGIGGYLMRLVKTLVLGARLQYLFEQQQRGDVQALLAATQRIESRIESRVESRAPTRGSVDALAESSEPGRETSRAPA